MPPQPVKTSKVTCKASHLALMVLQDESHTQQRFMSELICKAACHLAACEQPSTEEFRVTTVGSSSNESRSRSNTSDLRKGPSEALTSRFMSARQPLSACGRISRPSVFEGLASFAARWRSHGSKGWRSHTR